MKYAKEVIELMRPHSNRYFSMAQIMRNSTKGKDLPPKKYEAMRKGIRRVLEHLMESGQVSKTGEGRTVLYVWHGLGHEVCKNTGFLGRQLGQ